MAAVVHFVPVGHTKETLVESIRQYPISRVILLLGDNPSLESEQRARGIAKEITKDLGSVKIQEVEVDADNVPSAALAITELMKKEKESGNKVMVNLSGSLRSIGLAAYIAAIATKSEAYVGIPEYSGNKISGVKHVIDVPVMPLKQLSEGKRAILKLLKKAEYGIDQMIAKISPKLKKNSQEYLSERSRLSHHLNDLKQEKLVETIKEGKNIKIRLTQLGKIYMEGLGR